MGHKQRIRNQKKTKDTSTVKDRNKFGKYCISILSDSNHLEYYRVLYNFT